MRSSRQFQARRVAVAMLAAAAVAAPEVVFALPLRAVGLPASGRMTAVTAYAAIGTTATGPGCILDRIKLS